MPTDAIFKPAAPGERSEFAAKLDHMLARVSDRLANLRAKLDHRLVHLGLDLLLQRNFAVFENFLNVRPQLARLRIDDRKFLLDPERVDVIFHGHFVQQPPLADAAQVPVGFFLTNLLRPRSLAVTNSPAITH